MERDYNLIMEQLLLLSESCAIQRKDLKKAAVILEDTQKQLEYLKKLVNDEIPQKNKTYQMKILKKV
ncbi:hypothetical protein [Bacteroides cellulosilyticus]|jgi:hypothetical protein|uniref:hypothetical protein n=1 Tax=Bacteroides cellulosilyticus TaxID=246787 RepID=UPI0018A88A5F|nr:hypothetical protein [Bacteroides cellulosilyticus]DAL84074.1 MAG TPA: hypothetical protein [Bacteriophage sp.]DAO41364.1 MAG TPA: hypothetical protein [Caudoviricetes sp.]